MRINLAKLVAGLKIDYRIPACRLARPSFARQNLGGLAARLTIFYTDNTMKNIYIIIAALMFLGLALGWSIAYAQEESTAAPMLIQEESISAEDDLGISEPGLLPTSRFYFLKNITRGARKLFTFDPVKKAELELKFADEKIAEAKKVAEVSPERTEALERAVDNYQRSQEVLKTRLTALKETSQNPNVDRLLEKLADRAVKHEKLFEELQLKFEDKKRLQEKFDAAKGKIEEAMAEAAKKDQAKNFAGKIEKALVESRGSELKHVRSIEIIERIQEKTGGELKDRLTEIRNDFSMRLKEDLEGLAEKHQEAAPELIQKTLEGLPGDKAKRLVIIGEIRDLVARPSAAMPAGIPSSENRVQEALAGAEKALEKTFKERPDTEKLAGEALERLQNLILKLEEKIKEMASGLPPAVSRLADETRTHLKEARQAYGAKKFGEAFGQTRSAEVLLRNAFRILEEVKVPKGDDLRMDISTMEERLAGWEQRIERLSEELRPKAKEVLENARMHLRLAAETLTQGDPAGAKKHLEEAKSFERTLERIFETFRRETVPPAVGVSPQPEKKCGVNTFQVLEDCDGGFTQMYVQCYDGYEERPRGDQCQSSEIWQQKARAICENRCSISPAPKPLMPFPGPKPTPITPPTSTSRCDEIKRGLNELENLLRDGKISKEDYSRKYDAYQKDLAVCLNQTPLAPPKPGLAEPTPPSLKPAPTDTVCTQEYSPVCGINGRTYSNACHAGVAGVEIKYRGECEKPKEELQIKPLPLPSVIPLPYLAPKPTTETNAPTDQMR